MKRVRFTSKVMGWCEVKYTKQVYTYNYDYVGFQFFLLGTISINGTTLFFQSSSSFPLSPLLQHYYYYFIMID